MMRNFRVLRVFAVLLFVMFIVAGVFVVPAANANVLPGLSVSGSNIMANGQPVRLHGVTVCDLFQARNYNYDWLHWYDTQFYSLANYATLANDWHAKIVRIAIFPSQWWNYENNIEPYRSMLLPKLEEEVNAARNAGMYVIIDYHVIGWPNGWYAAGRPDNPPNSHDWNDSSLELAKRFWTQMATTYREQTDIIFDLWNEPAHGTGVGPGGNPDDCDGNSRWAALRPFYQDHLIKTVRDNGAQNIVLATGNCWASRLSGIALDPLDDLNVVYAYHKYSLQGGLDTAATWDADMGNLIVDGWPVIVSEYGYEDDDVLPSPWNPNGDNRIWPGTKADYFDHFTKWMDEKNLSNLAWSYHHDNRPALIFVNNIDVVEDLTKYGVAAKDYISGYKVTVATSGGVSAGGTVTIASNTGGINCTWNAAALGGTCISGVINAGTQVILTATLPAGTSVNWGVGCDATTPTTCTINALYGKKTISPVTTAAVNTSTITVSTTGTVSAGGTVTITSNTGGINCTWNGVVGGGTCLSGAINAGTQVILTANLPAGTSVNWGAGCDATAATTCTINALNANKIISPVTTTAVTPPKVLLGGAIANWPAGIPGGEKRPVVVFLPGWGGCANVPAALSGQNTNLVNQGYVTLAIGFEHTGPANCDWISNINEKALQGLDQLCADASVPANCKAIVLDGGSYGGIQNDLVIRYLRNNGYDGAGGSNRALGFVSEDAGYVPPGDWPGGIFSRTGLADTASYSVAMIQNLGDTTFDPDTCDPWGNCGARILSNAHLARGDNNVFSYCPVNGSHGDHTGFLGWNAWVISAIKTIIHVINNGIPTWAGYTPPQPVSNACVSIADVTAPVLTQVTPVLAQTYNQNPPYTFSSTEAGVITYGGSCSSWSASAVTGNNTITLATLDNGQLQEGTYNDCTIIVTDAAGNPSAPLAINPFMIDTAGVFFSWVWLEGGGGDFVTIQAAYGTALNPDGLRARAAFLSEDVTFGSNKNITLRGGYNSWYESLNSDARGYTTIRSLTIGGPNSGNSGVTIENIIIK